MVRFLVRGWCVSLIVKKVAESGAIGTVNNKRILAVHCFAGSYSVLSVSLSLLCIQDFATHAVSMKCNVRVS